ncbi:hypothetical protein L1049_019628 [Liquidambar formosana]|uniref:peptide-methionine (S)-S-oxide reductase n=1 Tax=Liquidambar formosana TaxID=63359 RepID=A0AAP0SCV3_LIQFO
MLTPTTTTTASASPLRLLSFCLSKPSVSLSKTPLSSLSKSSTFPQSSRPLSLHKPPMSWLGKLGFGTTKSPEPTMDSSSIAQGPDDDIPAPGQQFAQFGAGCFWGVELAFQRIPGVTRTEVGYTQGFLHNPSYNDVCSGTTNHSEVVRVQYDPKECSFETLLDMFWARHDPTTLNRQNERAPSILSSRDKSAQGQGGKAPLRQVYRPTATPSNHLGEPFVRGNDVGTQYRSGIYFYTPEQEKAALESLERQQKLLNRKIVTEILPAKKFYRAEEYHQQYLAKGGRFGFKQSSEKGCNDPIRCYG